MRSLRLQRAVLLLALTPAVASLLAACSGGRGPQTGASPTPGASGSPSATPAVSVTRPVPPSGTPVAVTVGTVQIECPPGFTPVQKTPAGHWTCPPAPGSPPQPTPPAPMDTQPFAGPAPTTHMGLDVIPLPVEPLRCAPGWQPLAFPRYGFGLCVPPGSLALLPASMPTREEPDRALVFLAAPGESVAAADPRHRQVGFGAMRVDGTVCLSGNGQVEEPGPVTLAGGRAVTGCVKHLEGVRAPEARRAVVVFSTSANYLMFAGFDLSNLPVPNSVPFPYPNLRPMASVLSGVDVVATLRSMDGGSQ